MCPRRAVGPAVADPDWPGPGTRWWTQTHYHDYCAFTYETKESKLRHNRMTTPTSWAIRFRIFNPNLILNSLDHLLSPILLLYGLSPVILTVYLAEASRKVEWARY